MSLHKRRPVDPEFGVASSAPVGSIMGAYPTVWEFLTSSSYDDGTKRATGSILFFSDLGVLKACVSDRDAQEVCFLSGETMEAILSRVECGLEEGSLEWRPTKGKARK